MSEEQQRMAKLLSQINEKPEKNTEKPSKTTNHTKKESIQTKKQNDNSESSEIGFQKNIILKRRKSTVDIIEDHSQPQKQIQTHKNHGKKKQNQNTSSNWENFLKSEQNNNNNQNGIKKKYQNKNDFNLTPDPKSFKGDTPIVAIDCEMILCEDRDAGQKKMLARISIVNYNGHVLLDTYVNPKRKVINFLTWVSGIQPQHIKTAPFFQEVQEKYKKILQGKIIVGHTINNDFDAMMYEHHDENKIRNIARYPFLKNQQGKTMSLKNMNQQFLGLKIQSGAHSSVEDARATMLIYKKFENEIEEHCKQNGHEITTKKSKKQKK